MSNSLRDRIAAVLYRRDGFIVPWDEAAEFLVRDYRKTADAVIAELGLTEQTRGPLTSYYDGRFHDDKTIYRHVTDWRTKK